MRAQSIRALRRSTISSGKPCGKLWAPSSGPNLHLASSPIFMIKYLSVVTTTRPAGRVSSGMGTFLMIIQFLVSIALIVVVVLQESKG